ncbi:2270_t:CDS:1, partial [Funneliformis caledonium]
KKRSVTDLISTSFNIPEMTCFVTDEEVTLQADGSLDILEVKSLLKQSFDKEIIEIGSSRSYKNSKHLCIDYEQYLGKVSDERYTESYIFS